MQMHCVPPERTERTATRFTRSPGTEALRGALVTSSKIFFRCRNDRTWVPGRHGICPGPSVIRWPSMQKKYFFFLKRAPPSRNLLIHLPYPSSSLTRAVSHPLPSSTVSPTSPPNRHTAKCWPLGCQEL